MFVYIYFKITTLPSLIIPKINEALSMLARLYEAKENAMMLRGSEKPEQLSKSMGEVKAVGLAQKYEEDIYTALDKDFNTAMALSHTFELARAINRFCAHKKPKRGGPLVQKRLKDLPSLEIHWVFYK